MGLSPVRTALQVGSIDQALKNKLWNAFIEDFFVQHSDLSLKGKDSNRASVCKYIWKHFFENRIDLIPSYGNGVVMCHMVLDHIQNSFFNAQWFEIYDFVEFIAGSFHLKSFINKCNIVLEQDMAGYRIVNDIIAQITSEEEISTIEQALDSTDAIKAVNVHLATALGFLSDRQTPDYRNSIKESISAVEALCRIAVSDDKATFGKAIAIIERQYSLHPTLKEAYSKIYGYTSDADGIRHAMLEDGLPIEFEDAKFMLVSCSAFINYLKVKLKL